MIKFPSSLYRQRYGQQVGFIPGTSHTFVLSWKAALCGKLRIFFSPFDGAAISIEGTYLLWQVWFPSFVLPSCPPTGFMVSRIFRFNVASSSISAWFPHPWAMANGVSIESVTKMLGHTNVQMPRHYARILDCTIIHETSQIKVNFIFRIE